MIEIKQHWSLFWNHQIQPGFLQRWVAPGFLPQVTFWSRQQSVDEPIHGGFLDLGAVGRVWPWRSHGAEKRKPTGRIKGLLRGIKWQKIRHRKGRRRKNKKNKKEEEEEGKQTRWIKKRKEKRREQEPEHWLNKTNKHTSNYNNDSKENNN